VSGEERCDSLVEAMEAIRAQYERGYAMAYACWHVRMWPGTGCEEPALARQCWEEFAWVGRREAADVPRGT
jgi:hypothetical protein